MKLFIRIYIFVLMLFIAVTTLSTISTTVGRADEMEKMLIYEQRLVGSMLTKEIQRWQTSGLWPFDALRKFTERKSFRFWWIIDQTGKIHLADKTGFIGTDVTAYIQKDGKQFRHPMRWTITRNKNENYGIYSESFVVGRKTWSFIFGFSTIDIQNAIDAIISSAIRNSLISAIIMGVFLFLLIRHFLAPLKHLEQGVALIGNGDFGFRLSAIPGNELGSLAKSVNAMAAQLEGRERNQKQQARELRHLRNYLKNIFDSMPSVLIGVDPNGTITQWNNAAELETGISAREAVGQTLIRTLPRFQGELEKIRQAIKTRQEIHEDKMQRVNDQKLLYENITIFPLIANGVEGAVIRIDNVTERIRIEEMMIQSEKMLSIGGLAAGMAHEINNPLGGMMQTASVVDDRLTDASISANRKAAEEAGIDLSKLQHYLEIRKIPSMLKRINESGRRAAGIVRNMLSFSRKGDNSMASEDAVALLEECLELSSVDYNLKKKYDFKNIEIIREYNENIPSISCNRSKIQQVFMNILRNGAEAMHEHFSQPKNKTDEKQRFVIRINHEKEAAMIRYEIEDNGPGIPDEIRRRIFEPFFTTKPVDSGTGLGLSVSYFIITENHKGEMFVESPPGKGAKFIVKLPVGM